eukprot:tig00000254_g22495.t1
MHSGSDEHLIQKPLSILWDAVKSPSASASVLGSTPRSVLSKEQYCRLHASLYRCLRTTFNETEAAAIAQHDWATDCGGGEAISLSGFTTSMISLAVKCVLPACGGRPVAEFLWAIVEAITDSAEFDPSVRSIRRPLRAWQQVPLGAALGAVVRIRTSFAAKDAAASGAVPAAPAAAAPSAAVASAPAWQPSLSPRDSRHPNAATPQFQRARSSWHGCSDGVIQMRRLAAANAALHPRPPKLSTI